MLNKCRQSKHWPKVKLWCYILLICSLLRGAFFYQNLHSPLNIEAVVESTEFTFQVAAGESFSKISSRLAKAGVLEHPFDLKLYARLTGLAAQIKVGEYTLVPGTSALQLLDSLTKGEVIYHQLVLLEGWTSAQALAAIQSNESIVSTIDPNNETAWRELLSSVNYTSGYYFDGLYPEGMFFPETYNFTRGTSDREILLRAHAMMEKVLAEEWAGRDLILPYENPYEALIMASIVEKETGLASEREQIAGVFIRRLEKNMRLQTDPTVIYGMGKDFNGNLSRANLRAKTPYNTYTNKGLPPTPIALAGREAIAASLHPEPGDSLYFVAKGDGSHYFSSTLVEHNQAVRQYQIKN